MSIVPNCENLFIVSGRNVWMRNIALAALSLCALGASATAGNQQEQAYFAIFAETKLMKMVGMPDIEMPALPPGIKLPPGTVLPGQATRSLNVRLWSPSIAPDGATASVAPPGSLKVGSKMDLEIYRPTAEESKTGGGAAGQFDPDKMPKFKILMYWGSSPTVRDGQPKVFDYGNLTPEQKAAMKDAAAKAQPMTKGGQYFYKPDWTTGYWPNSKQPGMIAGDATLAGKYDLTTSYTGNVSLDVPEGVDFLPAIKMSAPDLSQKLDFSKPLAFEWGGVPGSLGSAAQAIGMIGQDTLIMWTSSEVYSEGLMANTDFMQMAEVKQHVDAKQFMGPNATAMTIPAGIFKDVDFAMLMMTAWGPGAAADKAQPLPRLQTKSSLQVMLGGKKMDGMMGGRR